MTDWLLAQLPQYGFLLLGCCTFLSCLAVPLPASLLLLAAGGFIAAGDLSLMASIWAALAGAIVGDQAGYFAGRRGGKRLLARLDSVQSSVPVNGKKAKPKPTARPRVSLLAKATTLLAARGGIAVFLSRWLFSALGPYVNVAAGAASLPWGKFTIFGIAGELVWISLYIGVGYGFTGNLEAASSMVLNLLGLFAAGAVATALAFWLILTLRAEHAHKSHTRVKHP